MQSKHIRIQGFSIVEVMVGLAIGLISTLIVLQVYTNFEGQKRTTTTGADMQTNGGLGVFTISRDIRMAGYGFQFAAGSTLKSSQPLPAPFDNPLAGKPLMPSWIVNGAGTRPDQINMLFSDKSVASVLTRFMPGAPAAFSPVNPLNVWSTVGIAANDMMILYEGNISTLFQVDSPVPAPATANPALDHVTGAWNGAIASPYTYTSSARLMDLGNFVGHSYALDATGNLVLTSYSAATDTTTTQDIATDIVNMQAEYGFDTNPDPRSSINVNRWSSVMIDADGNGTSGDMPDIQRLYAIRLAIVARSALKEKRGPNGCDTTVNTTMSWSGGSIDLRRNPDGTTNADWQCYRYKLFETTVPLRNIVH